MALKLMQGLYSFVLVLITALLARYFTEQGMISFYDTLDIPPGTPENHYFSYERNLRFVVFELLHCAQVTQDFGTV